MKVLDLFQVSTYHEYYDVFYEEKVPWLKLYKETMLVSLVGKWETCMGPRGGCSLYYIRDNVEEASGSMRQRDIDERLLEKSV